MHMRTNSISPSNLSKFLYVKRIEHVSISLFFSSCYSFFLCPAGRNELFHRFLLSFTFFVCFLLLSPPTIIFGERNREIWGRTLIENILLFPLFSFFFSLSLVNNSGISSISTRFKRVSTSVFRDRSKSTSKDFLDALRKIVAIIFFHFPFGLALERFFLLKKNFLIFGKNLTKI